MRLFRVFPAAIALGLAACASTPANSAYVHIADPEKLFSAANYSSDVEAAVNAAGWGDRDETIKAAMNEKGGWPAKMKDESARWLGKDNVTKYNVVELARLTFHDQPAVLLHVPAAANQHMADGWKPASDFFIIIGKDGVPN